MDTYYEYLAVQVLNEKQIVTYRTVSRALKVNVNLAKQMLWEFHRRENARSAKSVHATYLLIGKQRGSTLSSTKSSQKQDGEDIVMDSSPPLPGSSMPISEPEASQPVITQQRTMLLVKQEDLEEAKSRFTDISSIHVYSLEASGLGDFQLLTECNQKVAAMLRTEDILETGKQYGTIQNANVKRRTRKTALPPVPTAKAASTKAEANVTASTNARRAPDAPAKSSTASKPTLVKQSSSGIAASFAKGASKPKTAPKTTSAAPTAAKETTMGGMSDDDGDADGEDQGTDIDVKAPSGKSKKDRQAELEAMMDAEDDEHDDEVMKDADEDDAAEEPAAPIDKDPPAETDKAAPSEAIVVENGRRRGRRRVMKKKTVRDEEGYLVTKEEAVWESFSEDEPVRKKATTTAAAPAPAGKKSSKQGQGNIMSFFSKK